MCHDNQTRSGYAGLGVLNHWFQLDGGYTATVAPQRRKQGRDRPPRFLVLAPMQPGQHWRRTLCTGSVIDGRCVVDHGLISDALRAQLETNCARVLPQ